MSNDELWKNCSSFQNIHIWPLFKQLYLSFLSTEINNNKKKDENGHRLRSFQFLKVCHFHIGFPTRQKPPNFREITPSPYCFLKWSFSKIINQFHSYSYCFLLSSFYLFSAWVRNLFLTVCYCMKEVVILDCKILKSFLV